MTAATKTAPSKPQPLAAPPFSGRRTALFAVLVIGAVALAYHNSLDGPFIFDDHVSIEQNPNVRELRPLTRAMGAPPASGVAGRPIVSLSLAVNYAIGGFDVTGYHVFNALVHVCSALLLLGAVRRTLRLLPASDDDSERSPGLKAGAYRIARDSDALALAIALLWAVHPLLTETVTYVIQRTEGLMGLFFLATFYCFIRGATSPAPRARVTWCVLAIIACALGMGSKEVMVVAPLLVLLYDRLFLAGAFRKALRRRWPLYVGLALTTAIIPVLLVTSVSFRSKSGTGFESITAWDNLKTQAGVIVHYLRLAIWPNALCIDYDDWPIARSLASVLPQALLVVALLAASAYGLWRGSRLAFLGAWFFLILAPTSSFLPLGTEIAGERRMYLPTIALVALAVLGGYAALRRFAGPSARFAGAAAVALVAAVMIWATVARNELYADDVAIYSDAAAKRPRNARAMMNVGVALYARGELDAAAQSFRLAIERNSAYPDAYYNLGVAERDAGRRDAAKANFAAAIQRRPTWVLPFLRLGEMFAQDGQTAEAQQMYREARRRAEAAKLEPLIREIDEKLAALAKPEPA